MKLFAIRLSPETIHDKGGGISTVLGLPWYLMIMPIKTKPLPLMKQDPVDEQHPLCLWIHLGNSTYSIAIDAQDQIY